MARKPVLEGGKRDEIITAAMELFFENGYEATSVRMIMDKVGGEIGMFYHYFKSKDMLFDKVAERFFECCGKAFGETMASCEDPCGFVDAFLPVYAESMGRFDRLRGNMHWTIQLAMHAMTVSSLIPLTEDMLRRWGTESSVPADILSGQLIYGISAAIHSKSFGMMDDEEKKECLLGFIGRVLG